MKFNFSKLTNPLLYYIDKNGHSVFKNYNLFENDGYFYDELIQVKDAGIVLEYRIDLDRKLKYCNIITVLLLYFLCIYLQFNIFEILLEFVVLGGVIFCTRKFASKLYSQKLKVFYGEYQIVDFCPKVSQDKKDMYDKNYLSKIFVYFIITVLLFLPSIILLKGIAFVGNRKEPDLKHVAVLTSIYTAFYPKTPLIYDVNAVSKYKNGDFVGSADDYIKIFRMTGKKFTDKDYRRFANILFLVRKAKGTQNAIDIFNEYSTSKNLTFEQQLKLLWIKSNFAISSGESEFVIQDYNELLDSVAGDKRREFYILADKAYMLCLMKNYKSAIKIYNNLIPYAHSDEKVFGNQLKALYLERGFAKLEFGDQKGADADFVKSHVDINEIAKYEPIVIQPEFIMGDF